VNEIYKQLIILAIKAVSYSFLIAMSGTMFFMFLYGLATYDGNPQHFYLNDLATEVLATGASGFCFYFGVKESLKIGPALKALTGRKPRGNGSENDSER
jgi:hypothetical protein